MLPQLLLLTALLAAPAPAADVDQRAESILQKMTLEEKVDAIGGVNGFYVRALPRLGLPAIKMADGPFGVRKNGPATTFAGGIALAAAWDPALARDVGATIGRDARARGVHIMLGPAVNIYRAPLCGRNFEYMGEDPFLAGRTAAAYIDGMQAQGVSATIKHFMANNQEWDRHRISSDMDERTMREIYLPAFEASVMASIRTRGCFVKEVPYSSRFTMESRSPCSSRARMALSRCWVQARQRVSSASLSSAGSRSRCSSRIGRASV